MYYIYMILHSCRGLNTIAEIPYGPHVFGQIVASLNSGQPQKQLGFHQTKINPRNQCVNFGK